MAVRFMNKKFILSLLAIILVPFSAKVLAYDNDLNKRLLSCTPTKDFHADSITTYQISGLTGSTCIFKIQYNYYSNKPDLICKVPSSRMYEMTSYDPITVKNIKKQYCVISIKSTKKTKKVYY